MKSEYLRLMPSLYTLKSCTRYYLSGQVFVAKQVRNNQLYITTKMTQNGICIFPIQLQNWDCPHSQ